PISLFRISSLKKCRSFSNNRLDKYTVTLVDNQTTLPVIISFRHMPYLVFSLIPIQTHFVIGSLFLQWHLLAKSIGLLLLLNSLIPDGHNRSSFALSQSK